MEVYRVEHMKWRDADHCLFAGPYRLDSGLDEMRHEHNAEADLSIHPGIMWDIPFGDMPRDFDYFACGFEHIQHAYTWFKGWLVDLEHKGFHLSAYEVPSDRVMRTRSGKQVFFDTRVAGSIFAMKLLPVAVS